jgi:carbamate kinase
MSEDIDRMTAGEATALLDAGEFGAGSMGPKMRSAIRFIEAGGTRAVIAELDEGPAALRGEGGTEILPH